MKKVKTNHHSVLIGVLWMSIHCLNLALSLAFARILKQEISPYQFCFLTNLISITVLLPIALFTKYNFRNILLKTNMIRGLMGVVYQIPLYYATTQMPFTQVNAITLAYPVFATIIAMIFLKERLDVKRKIALIISIIGSIIVINPSDQFNAIGVSCALFTAFIWANMDVIGKTHSIKNLDEPAHHTALSIFTTSTIVAFLISTVTGFKPISYELLSLEITIPFMTSNFISLLILASIFYALSFIFLYKAFLEKTDIAILSAAHSTTVIFATIIAYIFFNEIVQLNVLKGSIIVIIATTYMLHREYLLHKKKA